MKPIEQNNTIVSTSSNATSFGIEENDFMYKVLSDDIYEYKIRAIIRELSCNAYDSHVDAGKKDQPFRIHLPTPFHPFFEIEDYGIGLDDLDVRGKEVELYDEEGNVVEVKHKGGLYTRYFASTKRDSNDKIGALGLGSKSPLAYTNAMTLVTRKNGVEYSYTCTMTAKGPETRYHGQKPTEKGNGVTIRFSVSTNDIDEFRTEAEYALATFRVKPETNVTLDYMLTDEQLDELEEKQIVILSGSDRYVRHNTSKVYAEMGGVVYPVNTIDTRFLGRDYMINEDDYNVGIDKEPKYHKFNKFAVKMLENMNSRGSHFLIHYDIGDLAFNPSREGLSQDQHTKFIFYKKLVGYLEEKLKQIQSDINKARQPIEAIKIYSQFGSPSLSDASAYQFNNKSIQELNYQKPFRAIAKNLKSSSNFYMHYLDNRSWYSTDVVVRRKNPSDLTMAELINIYDDAVTAGEEIICFYANSDDEWKATNKALRTLIKNEDPDESRRFFILKETGCDTKIFKQIRDIFVGQLKFYHISKLKDMVLKIDPFFYDKKKKGGVAQRVKSKTETRAKLITKDGLEESQVIDLEDFDRDTTFVVEFDKSSDKNFVWYIDQNNKQRMISISDVVRIIDFTDYETAIVRNGTNKKKVSDQNYPTFIDVLNEIEHEYNDDYEKYKKYELGDYAYVTVYDCPERQTWELIDESIRYYDSDKVTFELIIENDETAKDEFDALVNRVSEVMDSVSYEKGNRDIYQILYHKYVNDVFSADDGNDNLRDLKKEAAEEKNEIKDLTRNWNKSVKSRFPLMFSDVDENRQAVLEYIEMVNDREQRKINDDQKDAA